MENMNNPIGNMIRVLIIFFVFSILTIDVSCQETWDTTWESLRSRPYPQWFKDAKLGIFIHWGVYSVPAYGGRESYAEWYLRGLQAGNELRTHFMKTNYGEDFTYRDFAPLFRAELFDPDEWARLFVDAGARYIILVAKHHDGYCLWPSAQAPGWNSMDVGPHRDLVGELAGSVRKTNVKFGLYYSLPEWNHPLHRWYTDPNDQIEKYVDRHMIPQFRDLVSTYQPDVLFTDGEWYNTAEDWHARELIAWYYNLVGPDAIVNDRWGHGSNIGFRTPEYSSGLIESDRPWSEVRGLGRSFGLNRNEPLDAYMSGTELIHFFVKAVANGGGMTINVGPKADGQIPLLQQERLHQLGDWLNVNGEAIYGSEMWIRTGQERPVEVERVDTAIHFMWVRNTPMKPIREDDFTVQWSGFIRTDVTADYTFQGHADDGMRVWIDDKLVLDLWDQDENAAEGNVMENTVQNVEHGHIRLQAGTCYPVRVAYYETKQNAMVSLMWSENGGENTVIPSKNFFLTDHSDAENGLTGTYHSMYQYLAYTKNNGNVYAITLEWPEETLDLELETPPADTRVSLVGREGFLPWTHKDGHMRVDISGISYNELPSHDAWVFRIEGLK